MRAWRVAVFGSDSKARARNDAILVFLLEFNALDKVAGWVFKNYKLVCNNPVNDLLLLVLRHVV